LRWQKTPEKKKRRVHTFWKGEKQKKKKKKEARNIPPCDDLICEYRLSDTYMYYLGKETNSEEDVKASGAYSAYIHLVIAQLSDVSR
jgi:hypothetical protein